MANTIHKVKDMSIPRLTRQTFQLIAEILAYRRMAVGILAKDTVKGRAAEAAALAVLDQIMWAFAGKLADTNPLFDRDRFINTAGGE